MDFDRANQVMIKRLEDIVTGTVKPTNVDLNLYAHKLRKMELMKQGMEYSSAHRRALAEYGIEHKRGYESRLYSKEALEAGDKGFKKEVTSKK